MKHIIGLTKDKIVVEIYDNYAATHGAAHPEITEADLASAIAEISLGEKKFFISEIALEEVKFSNNCVTVNDGDVIEYRRRPNRDGETPFVVGRKPDKTNKMVIGICFDDPAKGGDGQMTVFTAFGGILAPREPWDKNIRSHEEMEESIRFWGDPQKGVRGTHALCEL